MNCDAALQLISEERDRDLAVAEKHALAEHLTHCSYCRFAQRSLAQAAEQWRQTTAAVPVPDADLMAETVRLRIRTSTTAERPSRAGWRSLALLGAPLAAAAAVALLLVRPDFTGGTDTTALRQPLPQAEYVEAGDAKATTMVYLDDETGWLIVWAAPPPGNGSG